MRLPRARVSERGTNGEGAGEVGERGTVSGPPYPRPRRSGMGGPRQYGRQGGMGAGPVATVEEEEGLTVGDPLSGF